MGCVGDRNGAPAPVLSLWIERYDCHSRDQSSVGGSKAFNKPEVNENIIDKSIIVAAFSIKLSLEWLIKDANVGVGASVPICEDSFALFAGTAFP